MSQPRLPARVGLMLASPGRALERVEAEGGGFRDAAWLVLVGIVCFRLEDLMRALLGITHLSAGTVVRQMLAVASHEVQEALLVALPASVAVTVLAGRGRRDPSRDLELGCAAYVPFFAVRAAYRTLDLEPLLGPLGYRANQAAIVVGGLAALAVVALGVRLARRRGQARAAGPGAAGAEAPAAPPAEAALAAAPAAAAASGAPGRIPGRARAAAAALAVVLGAALAVNGTWVARNADAIRPLVRGASAPDFTLARVDQTPGEMSLSSLRGKVVLLDFWATWCQPCLQMIPTLEKLYADFRGQGVEFLGINSDGASVTPEGVRDFLRQRAVSYPMVIDPVGDVASLYKVVALPHMVVVSRGGDVRKTFWGVTSQSELRSALAAAARE